MVHLRSPSSLAARHLRAVKKGFCRPHVAKSDDARIDCVPEPCFESLGGPLPPPPPPPLLTLSPHEQSSQRDELKSALALIEVQNETIAMLTSELERWRMHSHCQQLEYAQDSPNNDTERCAKLQTDLEIENRFYSLLRPHLPELVELVQKESRASLGALSASLSADIASVCTARVPELLKGFNEILQRQLTDISERIVALENPSKDADAMGEYRQYVTRNSDHVSPETEATMQGNQSVPPSAESDCIVQTHVKDECQPMPRCLGLMEPAIGIVQDDSRFKPLGADLTCDLMKNNNDCHQVPPSAEVDCISFPNKKKQEVCHEAPMSAELDLDAIGFVAEDCQLVPPSADLSGNVAEPVGNSMLDVESDCRLSEAVETCVSDPTTARTCSCADLDRPPAALGDTVRVFGLLRATHLNDRFALVRGLDASSNRFILKFPLSTELVKVRQENIEFPALCSMCKCEVTSSGCFSCGYGLECVSGNREQDSELESDNDMKSFPARANNDKNAASSGAKHGDERVAVDWQP